MAVLCKKVIVKIRTLTTRGDINSFNSRSPKEKKAFSRSLGRTSVQDLLRKENISYERIENSTDDHNRGKPIVVGGAKGAEISISHSGNLAVSAYSDEGPVGIDVELISKRPESFYKYSFTKRERTLISHDKKMVDFVSTLLWTAKESVLKAEGIGLSVPATSVESFINSNSCKKFFHGEVKTVSFLATFGSEKRVYCLISKITDNYIITTAYLK